MGIRVYEPASLHTTLNADTRGDPGMAQTHMMLTNILIELRVMNKYLEGIANGYIVRDDPDQMRVDETQSYPVTYTG